MTTFIQKERIACHALIAFFCLPFMQWELRAQSHGVDALVSSVGGDTRRVSRTSLRPFLIKRGDRLANGDEIITGSTGYVVIALSDGGQIIVHSNSRVRLKDFSAVHSTRELIEIMVGTVRVKIRHFGNKPNPYRLNSPAASIAVRGTEFAVDVQSSGETQVTVYEGLVEVSPLGDPAVKRLVGQGEFVIIRADGRIGMAMPGPGGELNGRSRISSNDPDPVQRLATSYQRSVDSVAQSSLETAPAMFVAFPDAHRDSLDNPAHASEFRQAQGDLLLVPSISRTDRLVVGGVKLASVGLSPAGFPYQGGPHRYDYSFTPQFTFFTPLRNSRYTLGGSLATGRTSLQALTLYLSRNTLAKLPEDKGAAAQNLSASDVDGGAASLTAIAGSFLLARRLGFDGHTSLGIRIERLGSDGSFLNIKSNSGVSGIKSETGAARTRITFGIAHEFNGNKRLDIYYRYGLASVNQRNSLGFGGGELVLLDSTDISTKSSEIGARWRSPLSRRILYGLEASYLYEQIWSRREYYDRSVTMKRDLARCLQFNGGWGITLQRNTIFSLDLGGGILNTTKPAADSPVNLSRFQSERGHFFSAHAAAQTDLWRKAFSSASFIVSMRKSNFELDPFAFELAPFAITPVVREFLRPPYQQNLTRKFSSMGVGWKFKPNFITEYLLSLDHNRRAPSHSLLLRYTFDINIFGEN